MYWAATNPATETLVSLSPTEIAFLLTFFVVPLIVTLGMGIFPSQEGPYRRVWKLAFWLGLPFAVVIGLMAFFLAWHWFLTDLTTQASRDLGWVGTVLVAGHLLPICIGAPVFFLIIAILVCAETVEYLERERNKDRLETEPPY